MKGSGPSFLLQENGHAPRFHSMGHTAILFVADYGLWRSETFDTICNVTFQDQEPVAPAVPILKRWSDHGPQAQQTPRYCRQTE